MRIVLDASVALSWCFKDEHAAVAQEMALAIIRNGAAVPSIWAAEVANGVAVGQRRSRIDAVQVQAFLELLREAPIWSDDQPPVPVVARVYEVALAYDLTAYDASYLELSIRLGLPLASFDKKLVQAAKRANVISLADGS